MRTLRFYADVGVLPEAARTESGYWLYGPEAVARARLLRTASGSVRSAGDGQVAMACWGWSEVL